MGSNLMITLYFSCLQECTELLRECLCKSGPVDFA